MLHPLVSLWRPPCRVTFYDQAVGSAADGGDLLQGMLPPLGARRNFRSGDEAASYLRYWVGDPSAQSELIWVLKRCAPVGIAGATAERWLNSLAGLLVQGSVVVVEETPRLARPGRLAPAPSSSAAAAAAALAAMPSIADVPAVPVPENLLPALEDVRIEGAEVLPELDQSLAQVTATMGTVEAAAADVQPAPDKVPTIGTQMTDTAASIQSTLDNL